MGSATTQALAATTAALDAAPAVDLDTARELFAAARIVGDSPQLSGALADSTAVPRGRTPSSTDVFGGRLSADHASSLLTTVAAQRWSRAVRPRRGIEELGGPRGCRRRSPSVDIEGELFAFVARSSPTTRARARARQPARRRRAEGRARRDAASTARASAATSLIVSSLVQQPRGRRVAPAARRARWTSVADQRGSIVATVITADAAHAPPRPSA